MRACARGVEAAVVSAGWTPHGLRMAARGLACAVRGKAAALALLDAPAMRALNARFRGKDAPTDVLAFPSHRAAGEPDAGLGDVAINGRACLCDAAKLRRPWQLHAARLAVHAGLHLRGFGHDTPADARKMAQEEARVMARLGHGVPLPRLIVRG